MVLPFVRPRAVRLLPLAALPAVWLALAGTDGVTEVPDLLFGVTLGLDAARRVLLGMAAALWTIAALAAQPMTGRPHAALFAGFWCVTLAGNLGVFLARDAVTFYVAFAAVSLAAWFLIVHERSATALRAGRVYIVIALGGEVALLIGLLLGAHAAGGLAIDAIRGAIGPAGAALLVIGFGIKAGLVPLHVWLPLAHPAAPVPASAVLSGAIVKAGLVGLLVFLPESLFSTALVALGFAGGFGAALWGLTQANPKAVLAYSTVSQMGLMSLLLGAGGKAAQALPYFALHHGLAKGALFLLVGAMMTARAGWQRLACLAVAALVAASVAGAPLTGGALAKAVAKTGLPGALETALSLSSVATSLVLLWFLFRLWQVEAQAGVARWPARFAPPVLAGALAFALPWALWGVWSGKPFTDPLATDSLIGAAWPVALALPVAAALFRHRLPERAPGDLLALLERGRVPAMPATVRLGMARDPSRPLDRGRAALARTETRLTRWRTTGVLVPLLVLALFALMR
jgi:formate hydrogenlyase subunit 3/multisubunit Na+/H+ antiporter MnhD subunit